MVVTTLGRVNVTTPGTPVPLSTDPEKKLTEKDHLPEKYNVKTTMTTDVSASGASDLKFEVTSK